MGAFELIVREVKVDKKRGAKHNEQLNRLSRIEGQIRGVAKMIEDQRYCTDILTQIKAIRSALTSVEVSIKEEHLNHCVHRAMASKNKVEIDKIFKEIKDLLKSSKN